MSDKEWYDGLPASELEGKHVHAVYDYGTVVDGELCRNGRVRLDHRDEDGAPVFVVDGGRVVNTFAHILSVSLVWDERDWEQIRTVDISKADAVVVNDRLLHVKNAFPGWFFTVEDPYVSTSFHAVSCALRRRSKLPTEPVYYRDGDGDIWIHRSGIWYRLLDTHYLIKVPLSEVHFPLNPVHFVDWRAE